MKGLENGWADIFSRKPEYLENKRYISYVILTAGELGLEYNKPQLIVTVKIMSSKWYKELQKAY